MSASKETVDRESGQHEVTCGRWFQYDENHKRYIPDAVCTCGAVQPPQQAEACLKCDNFYATAPTIIRQLLARTEGTRYRQFLATHDECVECGNAACRGTELFPVRVNGEVEARCWNCLNLTEKSAE